MFRKFLKIFFFISFLLVFSYSNSFCNDDNKINLDFENQYREIFYDESNRIYADSRSKYLSLLNDILSLSEFNADIYPVLFATAYRLNIATVKDNIFNVHQLSYQTDTFQLAIEKSNKVIQLLTKHKRDSDYDAQHLVFSSLIFSRAYVKIAYIYKIIVGIFWKDYMIYPPSEIINVINSCKKRFDGFLILFDIK